MIRSVQVRFCKVAEMSKKAEKKKGFPYSMTEAFYCPPVSQSKVVCRSTTTVNGRKYNYLFIIPSFLYMQFTAMY